MCILANKSDYQWGTDSFTVRRLEKEFIYLNFYLFVLFFIKLLIYIYIFILLSHHKLKQFAQAFIPLVQNTLITPSPLKAPPSLHWNKKKYWKIPRMNKIGEKKATHTTNIRK